MKKIFKTASLLSFVMLLSACSSINSTLNTASTTSTLPVVTNDLKLEVSKSVNTITELYAAGKSKIGTEGEEIARSKAEILAKDALRKTIQTEAFQDIRKSIDTAKLKSADFDDYKLKGYSNEIAVTLLSEAEKRSEFQTGNAEIGVIYVLPKQRVKDETEKFFQTRLQSEIDRLQQIKAPN